MRSAVGLVGLALVGLPLPVRADPNSSEPAPREQEVEVRGARSATSERDRTAASTVLDRDQTSEAGLDAARLVTRVPGVQTTRAGSSVDLSTLSLRGADSRQVPVYLAGIRLRDEVTGVSDLSLVPLWMLDRIEVYRGTSPAFASRFGLGGAVFFEPRKPSAREVQAGLDVGSFGRVGVRAGAAVATPADVRGPAAATSFSYRFQRATNDFDYLDDGGTVFDPSDDVSRRRVNADHESHDAWSISRFVTPTRFGAVRTDVVLGALDREQGVTGLGTIAAERARMAQKRLWAGVTSSAPCEFSPEPGEDACRLTMAVRGALQRQVTADPRGELGLGASWIASDSERTEARATLVSRRFDPFTFGVDAGFELASLRLDEPGFVRTRAEERVLSGGASVALETETTDVVFLGRFACLDVVGTEVDLERAYGECFPEARLGVAQRLTETLEVRANVQRAVRPPALGERYGIAAGARGNASLLVERGVSGDLGVRFEDELGRLGTFGAESFGFVRGADDLIAYRRSALGYVRPYNVGSARYLGVEGLVFADFFDHLIARANVTFLDPRDVSEGRRTESDLLPLLSRLTGFAEIEAYYDAPLRGVDRVALSLAGHYRGGRALDPAGLVVIAEQSSFDVELSLFTIERRLGTRVRVENVFDAALLDLVGYPLPGRAIYGSAEFRY